MKENERQLIVYLSGFKIVSGNHRNGRRADGSEYNTLDYKHMQQQITKQVTDQLNADDIKWLHSLKKKRANLKAMYLIRYGTNNRLDSVNGVKTTEDCIMQAINGLRKIIDSELKTKEVINDRQFIDMQISLRGTKEVETDSVTIIITENKADFFGDFME